MRTLNLLTLIFVMSLFGSSAFAQFTSKDQAKEKEFDTRSGQMPIDVLVNKTSRTEDINMFRKDMDMLSNAIDSKSSQEANIFRDQLVTLTQVEIVRSKKDLQNLKDGNIDHLEKWQKQNKAGESVNVEREISALTNRISHDQYLSNRFKNWDLSDLSDERTASSLIANMKTFLRNMERNLKYSSTQKAKTPPPGEGTIGAGKDDGTGQLTKKGKGDKPASDPRLENYKQQQKIRKSDFLKGQAELQNYAGDDRGGQKIFRNLTQVMMDEVNANTWIMNMINAGNIKDSGIDVAKLGSKLNQQRSILDQANKLRTAVSSDFAKNKTKMLEVVGNFAKTL